MREPRLQADAVIDMAKRLDDWPLLERAIDEKIEQQREFVQWWVESVGVRRGLNRHSKDNADRGSLPKDEAENLAGITQQQVSKSAKRLKDEGKYRAALYATIWKKAMGELPAASLAAVCVATPAAPAPRNSP